VFAIEQIRGNGALKMLIARAKAHFATMISIQLPIFSISYPIISLWISLELCVEESVYSNITTTQYLLTKPLSASRDK